MNKWKIWFRRYKDDGSICGGGVLPNEYAHKSSAVRYAKKHFAKSTHHTWIASQTNPCADK